MCAILHRQARACSVILIREELRSQLPCRGWVFFHGRHPDHMGLEALKLRLDLISKNGTDDTSSMLYLPPYAHIMREGTTVHGLFRALKGLSATSGRRGD